MFKFLQPMIPPQVKSETTQIPGLTLIQNFINPQEHEQLVSQIESMAWGSIGSRKVQQYGFKYNYRSRGVNKSDKICEIPEFCDFVVERMIEKELIQRAPDQCIINKYDSGQGIGRHIDSTVFGDIIISLSLCAPILFEFGKYENCKAQEKHEFWIKPMTLLIMKDDARYKWQHCIPKRKFDVVNGQKILRGMRISLTFRFVDN